MTTVGIILLGRMSSKRLPGKVLKNIQGQPILRHIIERVRYALLDIPLIVATSTDVSDDKIEEYCRLNGLACFRGSLDNPASRFLEASKHLGVEYAVRVNCDRPFIDPSLLAEFYGLIQTGSYDFITTGCHNEFPMGMNLEAVRVSFFEKEYARAAHTDMEHVTTFLYNKEVHGSKYTVPNTRYVHAPSFSLALDTQKDLDKIKNVCEILEKPLSLINIADLNYCESIESYDYSSVHSPFKELSTPYLIAEIGGNHEGDFSKAWELTELAIASGADSVKFQLYTGESLVNKSLSPDRHEHFQKFELSKDQHLRIASFIKSKGLSYSASVWSSEMLEWIDPYLDYYKIGSGDLTNWPLLSLFAQRGKPIILSTGLSFLEEVAATVQFLKRANPVYLNKHYLCIMQCTSDYPCQDHHANLNSIISLSSIPGTLTGYSDHTTDSEALYIAACMGASILEFHFTDSRRDKTFRDHHVSLTAQEVFELKDRLHRLKLLQGSSTKEPTPSEISSENTVTFRRAVFPSRTIRKGELLTRDNTVTLRPSIGLDPRNFSTYSNIYAAKDLQHLQPILDQDISTQQ